MEKKYSQKNKGFTLIETMIAVFILAAAISAILGLISSSFYSARYAKNELTANYLIQEVADYIRADRDSIAFQQIANPSGGWNNFLSKYGNSSSGTVCFSAKGCEIEPANTISSNINACSTVPTWGTINCKVLNYDESATYKDFYTYQNIGTTSNFKRSVNLSINPTINNPDELDITITVEWLNGNLVRSRTLHTSLLNWKK